MAIGLVFGGAALATAGAGSSVGAKSSPEAKASATAEVEAKKAEKAEQKAARSKVKTAGHEGRKQNHGFFVSSAAHCEDVSDSGLTFNAPSNCETDGEAKGAYVSEVAQSDIGKKPNPSED